MKRFSIRSAAWAIRYLVVLSLGVPFGVVSHYVSVREQATELIRTVCINVPKTVRCRLTAVRLSVTIISKRDLRRQKVV